MLITTDGIVIRERTVGETGKFIDVLTKEYGLVELSVRGAKKINSKSTAGTQMFAYSHFCYNTSKGRNTLNSTEPINIFYNIRNDLESLSLASYFSEIVSYSIGFEEQKNDVLKLVLNTFYYLSKGNRERALLKSLFELRFMSEIGLMPNIIACNECSAYEKENMIFAIDEGSLYCEECYNDGDREYIKVSLSVLKAVRHIVLSDFDRLYNFRVSAEAQKKLSSLSERYLISHIGRNFKTLDFYKSLN